MIRGHYIPIEGNVTVNLMDCAQYRLSATLEEIDRLKQSEFPYPHAEDALGIIESLFKQHEANLRQFTETTSQALVWDQCGQSLRRLFVYLPILGFVLRSTNTRNAFEIYSPLLRLSRKVLGPNTKLIISSEWEYSPFTYSRMPYIGDYVLIGLPAPESANPLLLPLAGHELGHRLWKAERIGDQYQQEIQAKVLKKVIDDYWDEYHALYPQCAKETLAQDMFPPGLGPAQVWSRRQAEEIFSDIFATRMFHESFLYASFYLATPGTLGERSVSYPNLERRVKHQIEAAEAFDVEVPEGFQDSFMTLSEPPDPAVRLLVKVADDVSSSLVPNLIERVREISDARNMPTRTQLNVTNIADGFARLVPTTEAYPLTDILNAGWICCRDDNLRNALPKSRRNERMEILQEIALKSIEVAEITERLGQPT